MSAYETDLSAWAEEQALLLRRVAAGERVNDGDLDWTNLAEEIAALGSSQRRIAQPYEAAAPASAKISLRDRASQPQLAQHHSLPA